MLHRRRRASARSATCSACSGSSSAVRRSTRAASTSCGSSTSRCSRRSATTGRPIPAHHPFTMPHADDWALLDASDPADLLQRPQQAYDLVLNGWELGSGSVRIHRSDIQQRIFELLGIGAEEAQAQVRVPARRVPLRRAAPRRLRLRHRPAGRAAGRRGEHPRGHRLPEDPVGRRSADLGAHADRPGASSTELGPAAAPQADLTGRVTVASGLRTRRPRAGRRDREQLVERRRCRLGRRRVERDPQLDAGLAAPAPRWRDVVDAGSRAARARRRRRRRPSAASARGGEEGHPERVGIAIEPSMTGLRSHGMVMPRRASATVSRRARRSSSEPATPVGGAVAGPARWSGAGRRRRGSATRGGSPSGRRHGPVGGMSAGRRRADGRRRLGRPPCSAVGCRAATRIGDDRRRPARPAAGSTLVRARRRRRSGLELTRR